MVPPAGAVLKSDWERFEQRVLGFEGDRALTELVLLPGANGPPPHRHLGFDELGVVVEGHLSLEIDGETRIVGPGEDLVFPAHHTHRPFNPSAERVVLRGSIPTTLLTCLSQLYRFMDEPENRRGTRPLLQLSMMRGYCDVHWAPVPIEHAIFALVQPVARVAGFASFYPEYAPTVVLEGTANR